MVIAHFQHGVHLEFIRATDKQEALGPSPVVGGCLSQDSEDGKVQLTEPRIREVVSPTLFIR